MHASFKIKKKFSQSCYKCILRYFPCNIYANKNLTLNQVRLNVLNYSPKAVKIMFDQLRSRLQLTSSGNPNETHKIEGPSQSFLALLVS